MVAPGWSTRLGMRGVVATERIPAGTVIEIPPLLRVPDAEVPALAATFLRQYLFSDPQGAVLCLGYGSLYNHDHESNAEMQYRSGRLMVVARRDIAIGEEVCIRYGDDEADVARRYGWE